MDELEVIHTDDEVVLHAEKVSKIYPGMQALDEVSFDVYKGKTNVLIGENGAGKSTLMKIIAGIEQESAGELFMGGEKVHFDNVSQARAHGIGIIHQELSLFPNLNVYQNIFMAREKTKNKIGLDNAQHVELTKKFWRGSNTQSTPTRLLAICALVSNK